MWVFDQPLVVLGASGDNRKQILLLLLSLKGL